MKTIILLLSAALAVISGFILHGAEPRETVDYYFSFFNSGGPEDLEDFRSCFIPEEREKIKAPPSNEIRTQYPVGELKIIDEAKTGNTYEVRYRLEKRSGIGYLVLENRDGLWLINPTKSATGRKDALSSQYEPGIPVDDPVPQPLSQTPQGQPVPSGWQPGPTPEWFVNYGSAAEKARRENRSMFILCTGADWCPPCKRLTGEVLLSDEFKEYAARNLVLLYLNFPRRSPQPSDQVKHNQEIRRKFGFHGGVPSYVLINPDGQIIRRRSGYLPLPAFMEFLQGEKPQEQPQQRAPIRQQEQRRNAKQQETRQDPIPATPSGWRRGPDSQWQIYYPAALALAKKNRKMVFVLHTGSDWCGFCIKLRKDVLSKREFKKYAAKNLILLYLDSPRRSPLPQEQQKHNNNVCRELAFPGGVPAFILLDEDGRVIMKSAGYRPLRDFMKLLKKAVKK